MGDKTYGSPVRLAALMFRPQATPRYTRLTASRLKAEEMTKKTDVVIFLSLLLSWYSYERKKDQEKSEAIYLSAMEICSGLSSLGCHIKPPFWKISYMWP